MKTQLLILCLFVSSLISAQSCLPEGINFTRQGQVDSFQINFPGCAHIEGAVSISDEVENLYALSVLQSVGRLWITGTQNLQSLAGLESLKTIDGQLMVFRNNKLESLGGLLNVTEVNGQMNIHGNNNLTEIGMSSLRTVSGPFELSSNSTLRDLKGLTSLIEMGHNCTIVGSPLKTLDGLNNLSSISGALHIEGTSLHSIAALQSLTSIGGYFRLESNGSLTSLDGLEQLESINGLFSIRDNPSLTSIAGLSNLQQVDGVITLIHLPGLLSLEGLESLTEVEGIQLYNLDLITDLTGLSSLKNVHGNLEIVRNDLLASLEGLDSLEAVNGHLLIDHNLNLRDVSSLEEVTHLGSLSILYNAELSLCNAMGICQHIASGGISEVGGNPAVCQNENEILQSCITGIEENDPDPIKIYPNPTTGYVTIEGIGEDSKGWITDCAGRFVGDLVNPHHQLDLNHLQTGMYLLFINTNGHITSRRVIKI
jgi:hypothetical protein